MRRTIKIMQKFQTSDNELEGNFHSCTIRNACDIAKLATACSGRHELLTLSFLFRSFYIIKRIYLSISISIYLSTYPSEQASKLLHVVIITHVYYNWLPRCSFQSGKFYQRCNCFVFNLLRSNASKKLPLYKRDGKIFKVVSEDYLHLRYLNFVRVVLSAKIVPGPWPRWIRIRIRICRACRHKIAALHLGLCVILL